MYSTLSMILPTSQASLKLNHLHSTLKLIETFQWYMSEQTRRAGGPFAIG